MAYLQKKWKIFKTKRRICISQISQLLFYLVLFCCNSAVKRISQRFTYIENQSSRLTSLGELKKIISTVWPHTPLCFFVSFFWVLFAPKNSGLNLDEPFQKIDFGDFGAFLGPNNAFSTHLRKFLGFLVMLIVFAFEFPTISAISRLTTRYAVRMLPIDLIL